VAALIYVVVQIRKAPGKPVSKVIDEQVDIYAFVFKTLNMSYGNTRETLQEVEVSSLQYRYIITSAC